MSDRRFLDIVYLLDNLQVRRSGDHEAVPETLDELKAVKQHIMTESFGQIEKAFLIKALRAANGNISQAAAEVGMQRPNFHALMKKHGITREAL
jgi:two-component system NtrC family response regulator